LYFLHYVQTGSGAHPAFYSTATGGSVLRGKGKLLRSFSFENAFVWEVCKFFAVFMLLKKKYV